MNVVTIQRLRGARRRESVAALIAASAKVVANFGYELFPGQ
jgi:hypothetical protein